MAELEATTVRKGNRRVSLTLSGQVTRSIMYWNDEFQSDVYSVDNALNTSRFRFVGSGKINADLQAGFMMELDIRLGARSNQVNQFDDDGISGSGGILGGAALGDGIGGAGDSVPGIRTANWWLESKHLGKLTVGRLNTATSGISIIDLSGSSVIISSEPGNSNGGFFMRNRFGVTGGATWSTQCGGPSAAGPYSSDCFEHGPSRRDAVRYDTPTLHGFTLSGHSARTISGTRPCGIAANGTVSVWLPVSAIGGMGIVSPTCRCLRRRPRANSRIPTGAIG